MGERTALIILSRKFLLIFIVLGFAAGIALAQDDAAQQEPTVTTKQSILTNKQGLADIQKKISEEKKKQKIDELKEKHVLNRMYRVNKTLHKIRKAKETNEVGLQQSQQRTARLQEAVGQKQEQLEESRQMLAQRLRDLYRASFHHPLLGGLLDADNFTDFARKLKFGIMLARSNEKLLAQTLEDEARLKRDSNVWMQEANRKEKILKTLDRKEKNYDQEQKNRQVSLETIRKEKEAREKTIRELTESAKDLQNKVSQLLKEAAKAPKKKRVVVTKTTTTNTVSNTKIETVYVPEGKGLQVVRGRIPWPVSGKIISYFGKTKDPRFNLMVDNSGIQIQAAQGTPIHAVAAGVVKFADWFKGYGKLVILDHGRGYYSLYAQAANLNVSEGDSVASGQVLGSVGDTDSLVGSSLYFEIRKNGTPQDPLHWLKYRN
ncbi:MAG TPA: peptidoglycan DD-metalloendopeptidase family protein, partial [bacterium]|nr:peptidoglycan DD-metalloendopeptidase family protein [bacterium]